MVKLVISNGAREIYILLEGGERIGVASVREELEAEFLTRVGKIIA